VLRERQIPACISNHAGTFVCNHFHYRALHAVAECGHGALCGLIHIPLMTEMLKPDAPPRPTLAKARVVEAVELCLDECERIAGRTRLTDSGSTGVSVNDSATESRIIRPAN